jgi:hypothetical protein
MTKDCRAWELSNNGLTGLNVNAASIRTSVVQPHEYLSSYELSMDEADARKTPPKLTVTERSRTERAPKQRQHLTMSARLRFAIK